MKFSQCIIMPLLLWLPHIVQSQSDSSHVDETVEILEIYSYKPQNKDSILFYRAEYDSSGRIVYTTDIHYHHYNKVPPVIYLGSIDVENIIAQGKGKKTYSNFDPLSCEVGGSYAYNKYEFYYDSLKRPLRILHYTKGIVQGTGGRYRYAGKIEFKYSDNYQIYSYSYNDEDELESTYLKKIDEEGRLIFIEKVYNDGSRTKWFYAYLI